MAPSAPSPTGVDPNAGGILSGVPRNAVLLGFVSFLNDMGSEMIVNFIPIFLRTLRPPVTMLTVGFIEGLVASLSSVLKPISGWFSDRMGRRKPGILLGYWLAACTRPLTAVSGAAWHILALRSADRVGKGIRVAPRDALIADSADPARRGKAFGVQRALDNAGAAVGLLIAAAVLFLVAGDVQVRLRTLFWIASVPGIGVLALIVWGVRERARTAGAPEGSRASPPLRSVMGSPLLKWYAIVFVFWLGNSADGFLLYKAATTLTGSGSPEDVLWQVPVLAFVMSAVAALFSIYAGSLSDRLGRRCVLLAGWVLYALVYAGLAFAESAWAIYLLFGFYGLYYALTAGVERALVSDLAPPQGRATALGVYQFVAGVAALPASLICGWLWELKGLGDNGPKVALGFGAACACVAAVLLLVLNPRPSADKGVGRSE